MRNLEIFIKWMLPNPKMLAGGVGGIGAVQRAHVYNAETRNKNKINETNNNNNSNDDTSNHDDKIIDATTNDNENNETRKILHHQNEHNERRYKHHHHHHQRILQRYSEDEDQQQPPAYVTLTHDDAIINSNGNETVINLKQRPNSSLGQISNMERANSPTSSNASTPSHQRHSLDYGHYHLQHAHAHAHHHIHHQQQLQEPHHLQHHQSQQQPHIHLHNSFSQHHAGHLSSQQHLLSSQHNITVSSTSPSSSSTSSTSAAAAAAAAAAANRRDNNIDYSTLFVQLSGTLPTLYRCVSCNKIVSNRWHHANIHRPQSHECPVCGQKFTRRDNMKAHCKIKHADMKDLFFSHYVHM